MIVPKGKSNFHGEQWISLREMLKFPRETYVPSFLTIAIISYLFLYRLATYHWNDFEENYDFVDENTLIKTHMQKLWLNKVSDTFAPQGNMVAF
jgi:hypothetical protein